MIDTDTAGMFQRLQHIDQLKPSYCIENVYARVHVTDILLNVCQLK